MGALLAIALALVFARGGSGAGLGSPRARFDALSEILLRMADAERKLGLARHALEGHASALGHLTVFIGGAAALFAGAFTLSLSAAKQAFTKGADLAAAIEGAPPDVKPLLSEAKHDLERVAELIKKLGLPQNASLESIAMERLALAKRHHFSIGSTQTKAQLDNQLAMLGIAND